MKIKWQCWRCSYKDDYSKFDDGSYKQGNKVYTVLRCPACHHLQGRIELKNIKDQQDLYAEMLSYMKQRHYLL